MADGQTAERVDQQQFETAAAAEPGAALGTREMTQPQIDETAREIGVDPGLFEEEYSPDEYAAMLGMYEETLTDIREREIITAHVLRTTENSVILDIGFKSEGAVSRDEFDNPEELEPGDEVDVFLESLEDEEGVVVLSKKRADFLRVWDQIKHAYENDEPVPGTLSHSIKGGATVDLMGVDAFLPGSQIALRRVQDIDALAGNQYEFKVLKLNKRRRNIVISRRVLLEKEREKQREHLVKELLVGQVRRGLVKNVTDFGAFIDLGGMDGLLHITDMSWGRVGHPGEIVDIGEHMDVKVLDIDWDRERISLGYKQLQPYPWQEIERKYPVGARIYGRVVSVTNYGAFVELEKGVEGLVHISEMSWTRNVKHPSQLVSIGDQIETVVLNVDKQGEKISLGMKQTQEDPWLALPLKYPEGTRITGTVRNLTSFGAFVEVEPGMDGLIHISDMSWTKRIEHPSEVLRQGEEVEVVVLSVDAEKKRISLGLKQTEDDPWTHISEQFAPGVETRGTVVRMLDDGVVVDLGEDIEGFVPLSQLGIADVGDPAEHLDQGEELELRVLESDPVNRRIVLSVVAMPGAEQGAPPEGTEIETGAEVRPTPEQVEQQEAEPESLAPDPAPAEPEGTEAPAEAEEPEAEATAEEPALEGSEEVVPPSETEAVPPQEIGAETAEEQPEEEKAAS